MPTAAQNRQLAGCHPSANIFTAAVTWPIECPSVIDMFKVSNSGGSEILVICTFFNFILLTETLQTQQLLDIVTSYE